MRLFTFLDAVSHIDDDILAESISMRDELAENRRKRLKFRKALIAVASVVLVCTVTLASVLIWGPFSSNADPFSELPLFEGLTARQMNGVFPQTESAYTNQYTKVYTPDEKYLFLPEMPQGEYVPILSHRNTGLPLNEEELLRYRDEIVPKLTKAFGATFRLTERWSHDRSWDNSPTISYRNSLESAIWADVTQRLTQTNVYISQSTLKNGYGEECIVPLVINGQTIQIDQTKSDEEIIASLEGIKKELFDLFSVEFSDVKILRHYNKIKYINGVPSENDPNVVDNISIYFYNKSDIYSSVYDNDRHQYIEHIRLNFNNSYSYQDLTPSKDILQDVSVRFVKYRLPLNETVTAVGKAELLTVKEAEELLKKGYVFGGHSCPLCMRNQTAVDFESYDAVGFEYLMDQNPRNKESSLIVPFYTFYKLIDELDDGYKTYAKTYVPAVHVDGLDEYFENQAKYHR